LARQGEVDAAKRRLELFEVDAEWKQAGLLTIAWLAAAKQPDEARRLRDQVKDTLSKADPLPLLLERVSNTLDNTPLSKLELPPPPPEEAVRELVANLGGKGANTELLQTLGINAVSPDEVPFYEVPFDDAPGRPQGYFAERDAPLLVAYADANRPDGDQYLKQYIAIHTTYNYVHYRNRSLLYLLDAVLRFTDLQWMQEMVTTLAVAALAGNLAEFQEGLPLTILGFRAMSGDAGDLDAQRELAIEGAEQLMNRDGEGDSWGFFRRRLASLAQIDALLLGHPGDADRLLERAMNLPYGFAGFNTPANLMLAEVLHICRPGDFHRINQALTAAQNSAHNIQDAIFCARSTARVNAMRDRWWRPDSFKVESVIRRLCRDAFPPEFSALHRVGEAYESRQSDLQTSPLPDWLRQADRLSVLAEVYQRPLAEFLRLNPGWTADEPLPPGCEINVPDLGFATLLSARLAAEVLVDQALSPEKRVELIQAMAPVAAPSPTSLDTVLARLLLAAQPTDLRILARIEQLARQSLEGGRSAMGPEIRPYGVPS
jgi:hypothetical protein